MVVWLIGLSGSGKSFFARKFVSELNKRNKKVIWIDGDNVRKYITFDLGYSLNDRKKNSFLISNLCNFLEKKNYIVICSILSIFREHQKRNRKIFKKYLQIYIKSDLKKLILQNNKKIYKKKNVVGIDIKFPEPYKSDFIINNSSKKEVDRKIFNDIIKRINV